MPDFKVSLAVASGLIYSGGTYTLATTIQPTWTDAIAQVIDSYYPDQLEFNFNRVLADCYNVAFGSSTHVTYAFGIEPLSVDGRYELHMRSVGGGISGQTITGSGVEFQARTVNSQGVYETLKADDPRYLYYDTRGKTFTDANIVIPAGLVCIYAEHIPATLGTSTQSTRAAYDRRYFSGRLEGSIIDHGAMGDLKLQRTENGGIVAINGTDRKYFTKGNSFWHQVH